MISATSSGVKVIPLGLAQVIAIVIIGALVSRFGHYVCSPLNSKNSGIDISSQVPFMALGQVVAIIGTVLLIRISITTRYVLIAVYLVISGIGFGMGLQMPFTGVQAVLRFHSSPFIYRRWLI